MKSDSLKKEKTGSVRRPPVVAIMGHIDHGKTTLLDYIRKTNVTAKEAGGITQHVSAYEISHKTPDGERAITFIDTPGHEAFAGIRSRGAKIADIAILIVSGEDGPKPQTIEALKFIIENKLPFIVAITKIDKPNANVERVKQAMLECEVYVEGYGGSVPCIPISSVTGQGINDLLDMILLISDMEEFSGFPKNQAEGTVLEISRTKEKGIVATLIVKDGTLRKGMSLAAGNCVSVLRTMENFLGKKIDVADPSTPVKVTGWSKAPSVGDLFLSFETKNQAEKYIELNVSGQKSQRHTDPAEARVILPIVVKADVESSLEAIEYELAKLTTDKIVPQIIQAGTGDINESDLKIASGDSKTLVLGFNVKVDSAAKSVAERFGLKIELFDIIYKLIERTQQILAEQTPKTEVVETRGQAKIIRFFSSVKDKQIIGGKVIDGSIGLGDEFKILRRGTEVGSGKIRELEQQKVKIKEVEKDREFGAMVEAKIEIAPGDVLETFVIVEK